MIEISIEWVLTLAFEEFWNLVLSLDWFPFPDVKSKISGRSFKNLKGSSLFLTSSAWPVKQIFWKNFINHFFKLLNFCYKWSFFWIFLFRFSNMVNIFRIFQKFINTKNDDFVLAGKFWNWYYENCGMLLASFVLTFSSKTWLVWEFRKNHKYRIIDFWFCTQIF